MNLTDQEYLRQLVSSPATDIKSLQLIHSNHVNEMRKYAWDHFQLHAGQRVTTFNFYITISTASTAALGATLQQTPIISVCLGFLIILFSFVFKKLDMRNKELIDRSRDALKYLENFFISRNKDVNYELIKLFKRDDYLVKPLRTKKYFLSWKNHYSYSESFAMIFFAFTCFGIAGILIGAINILILYSKI
jgi:hypothetical protein